MQTLVFIKFVRSPCYVAEHCEYRLFNLITHPNPVISHTQRDLFLSKTNEIGLDFYFTALTRELDRIHDQVLDDGSDPHVIKKKNL